MKQQYIFFGFLLMLNLSGSLRAQPSRQEKGNAPLTSQRIAFDDLFQRQKPQIREQQNNPPRVESFGEVKLYAVVVGVNNCPAMPPLRYAAADAMAIYNQLIASNRGELASGQIILLLNDDATLENITRALRNIALSADGNDVLNLYFSGHGIDGAFVPVDFDGYSNQLEHRYLLDLMEQSQAKHKLVVADACKSGGLNFNERFASKGPDDANRLYNAFENAGPGTALFVSSRAGESSLEDKQLQHGVFTHFLLQGMRGWADSNRDGLVNIGELFRYVHLHVLEMTNGAQSPEITGDYSDDLPISITQ